MIQGVVTEDGVPAIEIQVGGRLWQAIVDTGFNGDLELPERLRSHVNAQFIGRTTSLLAASQQVEEASILSIFLLTAVLRCRKRRWSMGTKS